MITLQVKTLGLHTDDVKQQLVDYLNACNLVSSYAYGFTNAKLSPLDNPPAWYSSFMEDFGIAKGHAMQWNSSIVPQLLSVPQNLCDMNQIVQAKFRTITQLLTQWQENPQDKTIQTEISDQLDSLYNRVTEEEDICTQLLSSIQEFDHNIQADYLTLKQGLDDSLHQLDSDQAEINRLKKEIDNLTEEIEANRTLLTVAEVGMGISIFVCIVGIGVGIATGGAYLAIVGVGVSGMIASIGTTITMSMKIQADQNKIAADSAELDSLSRDVLVLSANAETLKKLCAANQQAQEALLTIKSLWNEFAKNIKNLHKEINIVEADVSASDITGAIAEFVLVQKDWNELDAFSNQLVNINYQYNPNIQQIPHAN
ncbi:HBL/NHE enterotoxin family protein [Aneurinibacillus migulanus]|uniref:HBL/NHE enterotoxin family protein n=1 Tax=Aneurinibacillus migulanus TaxID=47500 RepID=UPI002E1B0332|nr:HBL/NHE enterotoxin family protein [Aneurinibacillus migulanus]MED4728369.1 HBL/NHE enterotoxin family protein [Aneurinibacillus migulanus]